MRTQHGPVAMRTRGEFQPLWEQIEARHHGVSKLAQRELASIYQTRSPHIDLVDEDDAYWLYTTTPNIREDDIAITAGARGMLILQGEQAVEVGSSEHDARRCPYRAFTRRFVLQQPVKQEAISTMRIDDKLAICIPKAVDQQMAQSGLVFV